MDQAKEVDELQYFDASAAGATDAKEHANTSLNIFPNAIKHMDLSLTSMSAISQGTEINRADNTDIERDEFDTSSAQSLNGEQFRKATKEEAAEMSDFSSKPVFDYGESLAPKGDASIKQSFIKNDSSLTDVIETSMENGDDSITKKKNLEAILYHGEQVKGLNELVPNSNQELDELALFFMKHCTFMQPRSNGETR